MIPFIGWKSCGLSIRLVPLLPHYRSRKLHKVLHQRLMLADPEGDATWSVGQAITRASIARKELKVRTIFIARAEQRIPAVFVDPHPLRDVS
jgi:hypothetical protein